MKKHNNKNHNNKIAFIFIYFCACGVLGIRVIKQKQSNKLGF